MSNPWDAKGKGPLGQSRRTDDLSAFPPQERTNVSKNPIFTFQEQMLQKISSTSDYPSLSGKEPFSKAPTRPQPGNDPLQAYLVSSQEMQGLESDLPGWEESTYSNEDGMGLEFEPPRARVTRPSVKGVPQKGPSMVDDLYRHFSQEDLLSVEEDIVPHIPTPPRHEAQKAHWFSDRGVGGKSAPEPTGSYRTTTPIREDLSKPQSHTGANLSAAAWVSQPSVPAVGRNADELGDSAYIQSGRSLMERFERTIVPPPGVDPGTIPPRPVRNRPGGPTQGTQAYRPQFGGGPQPPTHNPRPTNTLPQQHMRRGSVASRPRQATRPSAPLRLNQPSYAYNNGNMSRTRIPSLRYVQPQRTSLLSRISRFFLRLFGIE